MVVVFLHAFVTENAVFAAAQTVERTGLAIDSIFVITVVLVLEDSPRVEEAEHKMK
jgi:hypothetical protein